MRGESEHRARWWKPLGDGRIECDLCPRECKLHPDQRGHCFVRKRSGDQLVLTTYGRSSGFCIDPIEKKPLNHFFPGSRVLSFGTAGCNLACSFCQNWDISRSKDVDRLADVASPEAIAQRAKEHGCKSVAFTYNDPVIFSEYALDVADACHAQEIQTVAVTAGYISTEPRIEFFSKMDAANVDLKAFTEEFYWKMTGSHLKPVLETLIYLKKETNVWLEITTLLIPGQNDSSDEVEKLSTWVLENLGPEVPLHFSAFHPDYRMRGIDRTPVETLKRARRSALDLGLQYVFTGNVVDPEGDTTFCPNCRKSVIRRNWYEINDYQLSADGKCLHCGEIIAGRFTEFTRAFGRRQVPISIEPEGSD